MCLIVTLKRSLSDFYWTNVTDADAPFVGIVEQTKWVDPDDYRGKHVIYISAYVPQDDSRLGMTGEELIEVYLPAIQKMFPDFGPELIEHQALWTAPYAQPVVRVGYRHVIPETVSPISNLFVCTMAQIYPNDRQISNGVALAKKTAAIIEQRVFQA